MSKAKKEKQVLMGLEGAIENPKATVADSAEIVDYIAKMNPAQYWKWKAYIEDMEKSKIQKSLVEHRKKIMELEGEIHRLRLNAFNEALNNASKNAQNAEKAYHTVREELEKELGIAMKDCVVNEVDFTIKKL